MILSSSPEFTWVTVTRLQKKKFLQWPFGKKNKFDLSFEVLYQLNHGIIMIIYKTSNMEIHFPIFLHFFFGNCEAEQPHYDIDSKNLKRGLHIDINSIFPDFFLTFWWIQKFPDTSKFIDFFLNFLHYNFVLTFSWPVGTLQCFNDSIIKGVQWSGLWGARRLGLQVSAKRFLQNLKNVNIIDCSLSHQL